MTYITEEDVIAMFLIVEDRHGRFICRDRNGGCYIREGNKIVAISTSYRESGEQQILESYVIRTKNDIVKDILNDL